MTIKNRRVAGLDGRTLESKAYRVSQIIRKRIEEINGWIKTVGGFRKSRFIGIKLNQYLGYFVTAAFNLPLNSNLSAA